ncbi:hypothetical protein HanRHA438_Chr05g0230211 [Helianthus annuus]|nr:hypothetical protein HanRHA438_Chr05g0230211 [Helianthus annuus]
MTMKTIRNEKNTFADLSRDPVRKCEQSVDFASDVIVFLWPTSFSFSCNNFPVCQFIKKKLIVGLI